MANQGAMAIILNFLVVLLAVSETNAAEYLLSDGVSQGFLQSRAFAHDFQEDGTSAPGAFEEDGLSSRAGSDGLHVDQQASSSVSRSELGAVRNDLDEARSEVRFQAHVMNNMLAEMRSRDAGVTSHMRGSGRGGEDSWQAAKVDTLPTDSFSLAMEEPVESISALTPWLAEEELRPEPNRVPINYNIDRGMNMDLLPRDELDQALRIQAKEAPDIWDEDTSSDLNRISLLAEGFSPGNNSKTSKGSDSDGFWADPQKYYDEHLVKFHYSSFGFIITQLVIGIIYYFLVVQYYPALPRNAQPAEGAVQLQRMNPIRGALQATPKICICAFCCPSVRAAHTFGSAGVLNYWLSLLAMLFCPCCTLFLTSACTDLNIRLGGEDHGKWGLLGSALASWLCGCCLIAQDAQSLDLVAGVKTGFFTEPEVLPVRHNRWA